MKTIAISFSLEGQKFSKIKKELSRLKSHYDNMKEDGEPVQIQVVNGHLPKSVLEEIDGNPEVRETLDKLFPEQVNFFDEASGKVDSQGMAEYVSQMDGKVYIIGKTSEEELEAFNEWIDKEYITTISI